MFILLIRLGIINNEKLLNELNSNWQTILPITLEFASEPDDKKKQICEETKNFYFEGMPVGSQSLKNLSNVCENLLYILLYKRMYVLNLWCIIFIFLIKFQSYGDRINVHGMVKAAILHSGRNLLVYLTMFDFDGKDSVVTLRGFQRVGFGKKSVGRNS